MIFCGFIFVDHKNFNELIDFCDSHEHRVISCLPNAAGILASNSGFKVMFEFVKKHGSKKIYIPASKEKFNTKYDLDFDARHFTNLYSYIDSRGFIDMSSVWGVYTAVRRAAMLEDILRGKSNEDIINRFGITDRGIRKIKSSQFAQLVTTSCKEQAPW